MIFYDFGLFAPNPWIAWMFALEKNLTPERRHVDLLSRENRREPFITRVNPLGELPALELEDGTVITEVTAICEYLDEMYPEPPLIGRTPKERAETRMWARRIELHIAQPMGDGYSYTEGREFFLSDHKVEGVTTKAVLPVEAGEILKQKAKSKLLWLDGVMSGQEWVCQHGFSFADILLYCFLQFGEHHGQPIPEEAEWMKAFFERMLARPTAWQGEAGSLEQ